MARGGSRTPRNPAPVSNPQSGRRTDGGPGSARQPIRETSGGAYGERQALREQQQSAPLAASASAGVPPSGGGGGSVAPPPLGDVFRPTERPGESPLAGAVGMPDPGPNQADADMALRAMYRQFPHPQLLALIRRQV